MDLGEVLPVLHFLLCIVALVVNSELLGIWLLMNIQYE